MSLKKCIHCGRTMMCNKGEAHHKCSRLAQKKIEEFKKKVDYLKELKGIIKKHKECYFKLAVEKDKIGIDISAIYDSPSDKRTGGSRDFRSIKNALDWIIFGKEEK